MIAVCLPGLPIDVDVRGRMIQLKSYPPIVVVEDAESYTYRLHLLLTAENVQISANSAHFSPFQSHISAS